MSTLERIRAKMRDQEISPRERRDSVRAHMLSRIGKEWHEVPLTARIGKTFRNQGIPTSPEFRRIKDLPRRVWTEYEHLEFLRQEMTDWLKTPNGQQELLSLQAMALADFHDYGGAFVPAGVGRGKTIVSFVASRVVEAKRPLLLIPAGLREKTKREFAVLAKHWKAPENLVIKHYQWISRDAHSKFIEKYNPDCIICDEVHFLKNLRAACTKRVKRHMDEHPDTLFLGASGTITKRSLENFHHLLHWCLGPKNMPLPFERSEAARWGQVVDEKVPQNRRLAPGALLQFTVAAMEGEPPPGKKYYWEDDERYGLTEVRKGLGRRIFETPGVIASLSEDVDASILMEFYDPSLPLEVHEKIEEVQEKKKDLNGLDLVELVEIWRHTRELNCGFFYKWKHPAPDYWLTARSNYSAFQRKILDKDIPGLDTPLQITNAIIHGKLDDRGLYALWKHVKEDFKPKTIPVWISTKILEDVIDRVNKIKEPTLVWVEHVAVGEKLQELAGWKFFHHKGFDKDKNFVDDFAGKETIVLSIDSNREGRNLQTAAHNFVVSGPPVGYIWQQFMGRSHRMFQEADTVYFIVKLGHQVLHDGMRQACADAKFISETTGNPQKLMLADMVGCFHFDK